MVRSSPPSRIDGIRVLIVDDDVDTCELLTFAFEESGAVVRAARSVAEAKDELEALEPQVIISDLCMPDADGFELIRSLRNSSEPIRAGIPVIALTAFPEQWVSTRAVAAGFSRCLSKPTEPSELVKEVAALVRHRSH